MNSFIQATVTHFVSKHKKGHFMLVKILIITMIYIIYLTE